ncbi:MAG: cardiolipin synthase ClsB [Burkholderiaceae bacterium]
MNNPPRQLRRWLAPHAVFARGNDVTLLAGGAAYFPALLEAIDAARREIFLETYIFSDDPTANAVRDALVRAAQRGVKVRLIIDGFGSGEYGRRLARELPALGVAVRIYRPERWWQTFIGRGRELLRRLHRKLCVIDEQVAFVGGINLLDDWIDPNHGPLNAPRFDFAVRLQGPVVRNISLSMRRLAWQLHFSSLSQPPGGFPRFSQLSSTNSMPGGLPVAFVPRDNLRFRSTIEEAYLEAIGSARKRIVLANAYFFPGRRLRRALVDAAKRGVQVQLLLQGRVEYAIQHYGTQALYGQLLDAGVGIFEYTASFLHAKVAVVDDDWAMVGSSNIDPFSLSLAREANVIVRDTGFAQQLLTHLNTAIESGAEPVDPQAFAKRSLLVRLKNWAAYSVLRFGASISGAKGRY